jgi:hypothetical protein
MHSQIFSDGSHWFCAIGGTGNNGWNCSFFWGSTPTTPNPCSIGMCFTTNGPHGPEPGCAVNNTCSYEFAVYATCLTTAVPGVNATLTYPNPGALMKALANLGEEPTVVAATLASRTAAEYDPATNTIKWDQAQVNAAVLNGQSEEEILFHEEVHSYIQYNFAGIPESPPFTVTVGSYTITYDPAAANEPGVVNDYAHAIVANTVLTAYGNDQTGAVMNAFGYNPANPSVEDPRVSVTQMIDGKPTPVSAGANMLTAATNSTTSTFTTPYALTTSVASAMAAHGANCPVVPQATARRSESIGRSIPLAAPGFVKPSATVEQYVP